MSNGRNRHSVQRQRGHESSESQLTPCRLELDRDDETAIFEVGQWVLEKLAAETTRDIAVECQRAGVIVGDPESVR